MAKKQGTETPVLWLKEVVGCCKPEIVRSELSGIGPCSPRMQTPGILDVT